MSETKHSAEPWRAGRMDTESYDASSDSDGPWKAIYVDDPEPKIHLGKPLPLTVARGYGGPDTCRANARRIVACVNACAGIPTAALEAGALAKALESLYRFVSGPDDDYPESDAVDALRALGKLP